MGKCLCFAVPFGASFAAPSDALKASTMSEKQVRGWGNGYIAVPPEHPLHGKSDEVDTYVDAPGGFTFSASADDLLRWE